MTYSVIAKRWNEGWELPIDGVGVTQCRTLDRAEGQARDYLATALDVHDADVVVTVDLPKRLHEEVAAARAASTEAQTKQNGPHQA